MPLVEGMRKFSEAYDEKQRQINDEIERRKQEAECEKKERRQRKIRDRERETWEEKFIA